MHIHRTHPTDTEAILKVTADAKDLAAYKQAAIKHLGRDLRLPGFRPGKVPENLVEKNVSPVVLQNEFLERAVNHLYSQALAGEKLRPVANPELSIKKFVPFTDLEFEAKLQVVKLTKLADYHKIRKTLPAAKVEQKDVDAMLASLQARMAARAVVDRPAQDGDEVILDFAGKDTKGEPINGTAAKDFPLIIGSDSFIKGFEKNLVGLKAGESKTFDVTFPKDYQVAAIAGKKASFDVTVKSVNEIQPPELNDAFAAQAGPFKTIDDLKADVKKQLTYEAQTRINRTFENELFKEIADKSDIAVPQILIDDQLSRQEAQERQNLAYRGQTWEEHLTEEGVTEEEHRVRQTASATDTVKSSLLLSEIAEREGIMVTPEELDVRITILKGQYQDPTMRSELDKPENRQEIAARLMAEKTIDKLVGYVTSNTASRSPKK